MIEQEQESVHLSSSDDDTDTDTEEDQDPQVVFDDWMLTLTKVQRRMLSVLLYESFHGRQNLSNMDAAQELACITCSIVEQMCSQICF